MKKLLSLALAITLLMLTLPIAAFADTGAFDFSKLLTDESDAVAHVNGTDLTGTTKEGLWFAMKDSSSLEGILSTTTLKGIPLFVLENTTTWTYATLAAQTSECDKTLNVVDIVHGNWFPALSSSISTPLKSTASSTMGYLYDDGMNTIGNITLDYMELYINSDNVVYPLIVAFYDSNSHPELEWDESWPENNEELTTGLRQVLGTTNNYTFYTGSSTISSHKHTNLLYHAITAAAGEGGQITEPGEKLFRPGAIDQTYTITAEEGYTIYYIQVDGKTVPNSISCGDTASFTFDCIYGPRSIKAVFKKK